MVKIKAKILVCVLAASMTFSSAMVVPPAEAAVSVAKESSTTASKTASDESATLTDWRKNSAAAASIQKYVRRVTYKNSKSYIPVKDRIAVFDLDGTIIGELYPSYFEYMMFIHRALYDETYQASEEMNTGWNMFTPRMTMSYWAEIC